METTLPALGMRGWMTAVFLAASLTMAPGCGKTPQQGAPPDTASPAASTGREGEMSAPPLPTPGGLHIAGAVPLPGEMLRDRIIVFFDKPIVVPPAPGWPLNALLQPVTDNEKVRQAAAGETRLGPNYVTMTFAQPLPTLLLKMELSPYIQTTDGKGLRNDQRVLVFPTHPFSVAHLFTLPSADDTTGFGILFYLPPDKKALRDYLSVKRLDGAPVPFTIVEEPSASSAGSTAPYVAPRHFGPEHVVVLLSGVERLPVTVSIGAGLPDASGTQKLAQVWQGLYPESMAFSVRECVWEEISDETQTFRLRFSAAVLAADLANRLALKDAAGNAVPFENVSEDRAEIQRIRVKLPKTEEMELHVAVDADLPGPSQTVLGAPYACTLKHTPEPLVISDSWWDYRSGREGRAYHVYLNDTAAASDVRNHLVLDPKLPNLRIEPDGGTGFLLFGDWTSHQEYLMVITPGLPYGGGLVSKEPIPHSIKSDQVPPYVGFGWEGKCYFPRRMDGALPIESRNMRGAKVSLFRMFPSNIAVAVNAMNDGEGSFEFNERWSELIASQDVAFDAIPDRIVSTDLDLDALFPQDKKGVFGLSVTGEATSHKLLLWTNIGALTHWKDDELFLFAHDLFSLAPITGAKVTVHSQKNQMMGQANTDARGIVSFKGFTKNLGSPCIAVIETGDDFSFVELDPRADDITPFSDTMPVYDANAYDAFLYADRDLYRPGETIHARWIARTNYGDAMANVPLLASVLKPNNSELLTMPTTLSAHGTGGIDIETKKDFPTGKYLVRLSVPGNNEPIGTYAFSLEEFVPNRIKADVTLPAENLVAGKEYVAKIQAQHLFGAPAADRKSAAKLVFRRGGFTSEKWKGYRFDNDSDYVPDSVNIGEQKTDAAGNATFPFTYNPPAKATFPMKLYVMGNVFELGGRVIAARAEGVMFPASVALGVMAAASAEKDGIDVFAAAIHPDETPANIGKVKITLEKQTWNYYVRRYYSHYEPKFDESFDPIETREVEVIDGKASAKFTVPEWGRYRVRVHSDATPQFSTLPFNRYWRDRIELTDSNRPSLIKVALDKSLYAIGEDAAVRIESPFDGQGIVVVQHESIQEMIPVTIRDGVGATTVRVTPDLFPNAWIEATVIHAVQTDRRQTYPFSSFAAIHLPVRDPKRILTVDFPNLPQEVRPATETRFEVEVHDAAGAPVQSEVTLAAVDEGIHAITDYKNPDPYAWLSRTRKPDYRRAHYYDKVAYDFAQPHIGGDAELAARAGVNDETWIKPVALWSGAVQTNVDGKASATFALPEFTGQLRLVAVAADMYATGAKGAQFYVRRPYSLRTSMPRFLLPGDQARCRATVFNTTDTPCTAHVAWTISGALQEASGAQDVNVPARGEASFAVPVAANNEIGQGEVRWETSVFDAEGKEIERFAEPAPLPVRPPAAYQTAHSAMVLQPGETREVRNDQFVEDERASLEISVSGSPLLQIEPALQYLIGYPYGCVEQTVSRLMPLYLLRQNAAIVNSELLRREPVDLYLKAGITRLFAMQTPDGGLSYWPGGQPPYPYGSIYALHFLTLVKRDREIEPAAEPFAALQRYVRNVAEGTFLPDEDAYEKRHGDAFLRAYALYALALDGDAKALQALSQWDDARLPEVARCLIAAALAQAAGDLERAQRILADAPAAPDGPLDDHMLLDSPVRTDAIRLIALCQLHHDPKGMRETAQRLVEHVKAYPNGRTTQEAAFVISALSAYLTRVAPDVSKASGTVAINGEQQTVHGANVHRDKRRGAGSVYTVTNTGAAPLYVTAILRGVPTTGGQEPIARKMSIARRVFTHDGKEHAGATFQQAETYVVGLRFGVDGPIAAKNVVVEALLPAGFELENPRLTEGAAPGNAFKTPVTPSYMDVRDDRVVLAFDALNNDSWHYYVVRAVTPGAYQEPGARAECMYEPEIQAATAAGMIEVQ